VRIGWIESAARTGWRWLRAWPRSSRSQWLPAGCCSNVPMPEPRSSGAIRSEEAVAEVEQPISGALPLRKRWSEGFERSQGSLLDYEEWTNGRAHGALSRELTRRELLLVAEAFWAGKRMNATDRCLETLPRDLSHFLTWKACLKRS